MSGERGEGRVAYSFFGDAGGSAAIEKAVAVINQRRGEAFRDRVMRCRDKDVSVKYGFSLRIRTREIEKSRGSEASEPHSTHHNLEKIRD